jgi:hypothetical protein
MPTPPRKVPLRHNIDDLCRRQIAARDGGNAPPVVITLIYINALLFMATML